ncbi:putative transmembrane protein (PGPGW) [Micromonospora sp. MW-13]|uniref:TIGR02611 family protein n=1 Tax=unclassified Micromonospora TaxID=2617518 RepID=UPI000E430F14|nr:MULTISPECIES: TIGR02611 family protein [unclassified Micromonospora]MCX4473602.1 TIGR02611 family protein [Micromonospora sp. NBC_01655]RGC70296.1 putative transmembrane protein (PGPGW) [Micromonospora sp. MW-13]
MVTNRSSVDGPARPSPPKGGVRAAERRGYAVPKNQRDRRGRGGVDASSSGGGTAVAERRPRRWRQRLVSTLDLIRANPTGRVTLKIFISIAGALVVTIGVALIPLPGPGWLLVIAGLGIWAVEFHWARRLLNFTRRHVQGWTRWATSRSLPVRFVLGSVGLVFVAVVFWLSLKYSLGIDLLARLLHYLATH